MSAVSTSWATSAAFLLRQPSSYPERPQVVETIETHISHIFLTHRFAYKLKKPVRFAFLDFSTIEKRRQACENEVRVNRRLAGNVYLDVLPITQSAQGKLALNGSGTPIDWVVKMRRLPEAQSLHHLIITNGLLPRHTEALARMMSSFYLRQPPLTIQPFEYRARITDHVRSNWRDLLDSLPETSSTINQLHAAAMRYLTLRPGALDRRVCDGRIVDGHGDLRPDHVYFVSPPVVIDGIEFNDELREIDIVDELCFLAMECDRLGRPDVGQAVLQHYSQTTGDNPDATIIAFYKMYRACVRAKISVLSAAQAAGGSRPQHLDAAQQYLQLATDYLPSVGPRLAIAVTGLMGSGKSTLARALADSLGAELLQTDQLRREEFGATWTPEPYGEGKYRSELRDQVYREILGRGRELLADGESVIFDGTFLRASNRAAILKLAHESGATGVVVRCECPRDVAISRLKSRPREHADSSEAHPPLFDEQVAEFAADLRADRNESTLLRVDTREPLDEQLSNVLDYVKAQCDA